MSLGKSCVFTHPVEDGLFVGKQVLGRVEFNLFAVGQDEDLGVVHDGVEPVRDGQHGAIAELLPDRRLVKNLQTYIRKFNGNLDQYYKTIFAVIELL